MSYLVLSQSIDRSIDLPLVNLLLRRRCLVLSVVVILLFLWPILLGYFRALVIMAVAHDVDDDDNPKWPAVFFLLFVLIKRL